jgi:phosphatidylinositol phospholipase C, delta
MFQGYRPDLEANKATNIVSRKTLNLAFTFYAAQRLPYPPEDKSAKSFKPYVKVELHVDASDVAHGKPAKTDGHEREGDYKARTKTYKGCDIDLNGQKLEFKNIPGLVEDLTFVRFTVRDDEIGRDDLAGWACVRLDRLGEGYRYIQLLDVDGGMTEGVILVKVEKTLS